jgi:hypothetical protein
MAREGNSKEFHPEEPDEAIDELDRLTESWNQRLSINNLSLAERYLKNEMGGLNVLLKIGGHTPVEFVAVFQRVPPVGQVELDGWEYWHTRCVRTWRDRSRKLNVYHRKGRSDLDNGSVLIDSIELVETPQRVALPASIRLQSSDEFFNVGTNALEKSLRSPFGKLRLSPVYWKVGLVNYALRDGIFTNTALDQAHSECIERRAQIVDNVADRPAPLQWDAFHYLKLIDYCVALRIVINEDSIGIASLEPVDFGIEIVEVFFGPIEL